MIKAIAFDPGKTTGFATGEIDEVKVATATQLDGGIAKCDVCGEIDLEDVRHKHQSPMLVQTAQAELTHGDIMNFLNDFKPDYIICERFDFRQKARTGLELISREFIGIINLYIEMNPNCTLVMQTAAQMKGGYWSDDKLKALTLYRKPIAGVSQIHANEACKHLLYWAKFGSGAQYAKEIEAKP